MKKVVYFLTLTYVLSATLDVVAQRRKRDRSEETPDFTVTLTEDDLMQAEYLFVEGEKFYILDQYRDALDRFTESLRYNPQSAATNYKVGQTYYALDQYSDALAYALKAKELSPTNKYYYILVADIHTNMSNFGQAAETYEDMMSKISGTEGHLYELAAFYLYDNNYEQALNTYDRAKERFGVMEEVAYQKQQIYLQLGQEDQAINEIKQLVETFPGESIYVIDLAKLLLNQGRLEEAIASLGKLLEEDPKNATASVMLSEAYRKSGDSEKATEALKGAFENSSLNYQAKMQLLASFMAQLPDKQVETVALELSSKITDEHPDEARGFAIAGDLQFQLGDKAKAAENYRIAARLDNSNFALWQNAIQLELELQHYDSAIVHSEEALEYFPNQAVLYYYNGTANLIQKNYRDAIRSLDQGKKYTSSNPELRSIFYGQLGDAYNGVGDHTNSDASYEEALKAQADNDHVLNNYSYFLSLRKVNLEKAREMSGKLINKYPRNSTYLDTHAWVLYMLKEYKLAYSYLETAIEDNSASGTIHEHLGDVLFQLNKVDQAIEQWEKARELGGTTDLIDKKIADRKLYE